MEHQDIEALAVSVESLDLQEILTWAVTEFSPRLVMSTAFGIGGIVLMHCLKQLGYQIPIFLYRYGVVIS